MALLLQLAAFGAIIAITARSLPSHIVAALPFLLLPLFATASALWSEVPSVTLRYGVQLGMTVFIGVVLARVLTLRDLMLAVFVGTSLACLFGLVSGRTGPSLEGPVLIGWAGSKNQISYFVLFWIGAALCVLASRQHGLLLRLAAAFSLVPAAFLLVQGDSATALVSAAVLVMVLALLGASSWLGRGGRMFLLGSAVLLVVPLLVALPQVEQQTERLRTDVLEKDARLTGRTVLWEAADSLIRQKPVFGHGYKAIWLGSEGKGLLARNQQRDGRAFHFHDTLRELHVDLGLVGLLLFLAPLAFVCLRLVPLLLAKIDAPRAFAAGTLLTLLLRIRTELVIGPFLTETVLLYALLAALAVLPLAERDERDAAAPATARPGQARLRPRPRSRPERKPA